MLRQDPLHHLWGPGQSENAGPLFKRQEKRAMKGAKIQNAFLSSAISLLTCHGGFYLLFHVVLPWVRTGPHAPQLHTHVPHWPLAADPRAMPCRVPCTHPRQMGSPRDHIICARGSGYLDQDGMRLIPTESPLSVPRYCWPGVGTDATVLHAVLVPNHDSPHTASRPLTGGEQQWSRSGSWEGRARWPGAPDRDRDRQREAFSAGSGWGPCPSSGRGGCTRPRA